MPKPPPIPDHDGRPTPGLPEALREIDRRWGLHPCRRLLRAAAAYNHGDPVALHRELSAGLSEVAHDYGLPHGEVTRATLPASERLARSPRPEN